jgi:hypothetical protein
MRFICFDFLGRERKNDQRPPALKSLKSLAVVLLGLGEAHVHNKENSMTLEQLE